MLSAISKYTVITNAVALSLFLVSIPVSADNSIPGAPEWSTPTRGLALEEIEQSELKTVQGSQQQYTQQQIDNKFSAPDWFPEKHSPMPDIVRYGKKPGVWACSSCHLASGYGHPESSTLAGLSSSYMINQLKAFASNDRLDYSGHMNRMAAQLTEQEMIDAANWFASLNAGSFINVIETSTVPETRVDDTRMRKVIPGDKLVALEGRIIEVAQRPDEVLKRSPYETFISYVPEGSINRGKNLVETGAGKTLACAGCHGSDLSGTELAPNIVGNFGIYTVRQLHGFKSGSRKGGNAILMQSVVNNLSDNDIVDIAAYLSSMVPN